MLRKLPKIFSTLTFLTLLSTMGWGSENETQAVMNRVLDHYLTIQEKLANDTSSGIESEAENISKAISIFFKQPCKPSEASCAAVMQKILTASQKMKATDIQTLRKSFGDLSKAMVEYWEKFNPPWNDIFVFRCPMANDQKGSPWLQKGSELKNPYFGKTMKNCGIPLKS